jgi:hypothetical protein
MNSINQDVGGFVAGLLSNDLTRDQQLSFGHRQVDLAELILERAEGVPAVVIEGSVSDDDNHCTEDPTTRVCVEGATKQQASTLAS